MNLEKLLGKEIDESKQGDALSIPSSDKSTKKMYLESYGCQMNFSDSEIVASILTKEGFSTTQDITEADIVFVNPINIGYSRILKSMTKKEAADKFFGVNQDIEYLAEWISTFVTRSSRWKSPKYLVGESYGGVRVMGLAHELQQNQWLYLNGVVLVSPADYEYFYSDGDVIQLVGDFPYLSATAWYHQKLQIEYQSLGLEELIKISEKFAYNELLPAIAKGGFIDSETKNEIAKKIEDLTGVSFEDIIDNNLRISPSFFWKELLRDEGFTIGRLDSRYLGLDKMVAGSRPDSNAELDSWEHSFTPAINHYLRNNLGFKTDLKYNLFGSVRPWDNRNDSTRDDLRQAMAQNPYLKVLVQSGYYDGATTYFQAKYTMWHVDPSGKMKDRFTYKGYRSGHMMYLRAEDLESSNEDLRVFIKNSLSNGKSAKY